MVDGCVDVEAHPSLDWAEFVRKRENTQQNLTIEP